jgi:TetR/AcrR family transcriptional regulator, repressor of fatR-cypB operon
MKKSNKRDDILQAALEIISEHGFHGAPMSTIAEKAGVGAGTIYCYFKSKDELIIEINRILEEKMLLAMEKNYPFNKDIKKRFFHLYNTVFTYLINHPVHFRFLEQYFYSPYGVSVHKERIVGTSGEPNIFQKLVKQGIEQKVIKDMPLFMHFAIAYGPIIILVRNHVLGLVELDNIQINQAIEAVWDAIKK